MKRTLCLLLALLLLCGCTPAPVAPDTTSSATESAQAALAGPDALTEERVLLYRQADFDARQGTLLPLEALRSAPEEALLPRTHHYDDLFPGDAALWLRLLDYALANGYQGFSVPEGTLPSIEATQRRALEFTYPIDGGKVLTQERDGCTTVWYDCRKPDAIEKFSLGLAEARKIAAEAPRGDDWATADWIFTWLADNVSYADRDPYYFKRGHQLYDALVERDCLCSGYADAMYYLCNLCGVDCLEVQGLANNPDKAGGLDDHVWNLARLGESWYVFDPTFNAGTKAGVSLLFALSSDAAQHVGGLQPTGIYTDKSLIPVCARSFDPVAEWNETPEGALRSWLLYAAYRALDPTYLLFCSGLMTDETVITLSEDERQATLNIPYSDFAAWAGRYMSEAAAGVFPAAFSETEDGMLCVRLPERDGGVNWMKLELVSVAREADGAYSADLGLTGASFTVSRSADGLYRIESMELP